MSTTCAATESSTETLAQMQAATNLAANLEAIARTQPDLVIAESIESAEWTFGRDRALTLRDSDQRWLSGCSLPRRAAAEMMRELDVTGPVACFLSPTHAAQIRIALDKLNPEQAILAILPDARQLATLLACEHFAADILKHRLWLVAGENWPADMKKLFADRAGLCTPTQFIRLPVLDETIVESLIAPAQKIFAEVTAGRLAMARTSRENYPPPAACGLALPAIPHRADKICIVTRSRFRLWDDAGQTLVDALAACDSLCVDLDDPLSASSLALAQNAHTCGVIITANTTRADLPGVLSETLPWITWAGGPQMPSFVGAGPMDKLITTSTRLAKSAGWPAECIIEAAWPTIQLPAASSQSLAIIADTAPLDPPENLTEYSSHRLLWELITADLHADPFELDDDIEMFLHRRMRKLDIAGDTLPRQRFISELIVPAYQQSIARLLMRGGITLRLHGKGWDRIAEFAGIAAGAIQSRQQLHQAAADSAGLVHVWPASGPHPIDALSRPTLCGCTNSAKSFLANAKQILAGSATAKTLSAAPLSAELIHHVIASLH